jgi:hypothetical protein
MSTSEVEALFAQTLLGHYEGEDAWAAVSVLRQNGSHEMHLKWLLVTRLLGLPLKRQM